MSNQADRRTSKSQIDLFILQSQLFGPQASLLGHRSAVFCSHCSPCPPVLPTHDIWRLSRLETGHSAGRTRLSTASYRSRLSPTTSLGGSRSSASRVTSAVCALSGSLTRTGMCRGVCSEGCMEGQQCAGPGAWPRHPPGATAAGPQGAHTTNVSRPTLFLCFCPVSFPLWCRCEVDNSHLWRMSLVLLVIQGRGCTTALLQGSGTRDSTFYCSSTYFTEGMGKFKAMGNFGLAMVVRAKVAKWEGP